jgi:hypothetical protein
MAGGTGSGSIHLVANARTATSPTAHFTHPFGQIAGMVYEELGKKLLGGQISGAGLLVWNSAAARTGDVTATDYKLDDAVAFHLDIGASPVGGGRLFASAYGPNVFIWNSIGTVGAPKSPDVTMTSVCGATGVGPEIRYLTVKDDVLVVIHNHIDSSTNTQIETVCLFQGASSISGSRAPDAIAASPALKSTGSNRDKAWLTTDGHLFVVVADGVVIFRNAKTAPVFVTKLTSGIGVPYDLIVME